MIISASRRTDIPAFYAEWFMERVRNGYVLVRNPYDAHKLKSVSLAPVDVDAIVFWTRNGEKLIPFLHELDDRGYRYYFQYTITGYPKQLERNVPDLPRAIDTFIKLSDRAGPGGVIWRYDPILISKLTDVSSHLDRFQEIATSLSGKTDSVVVSILEPYKKTLRNLQSMAKLAEADIQWSTETLQHLISELNGIARSHGIKMRSCATQTDFTGAGLLPGKCIDEERLKKLFDMDVPGKKDRGQRPACNCVKSIDIGQYNTCLHGCSYCYATFDHGRAVKNRAMHDVASPMLVGRAGHDIKNTISNVQQGRLL